MKFLRQIYLFVFVVGMLLTWGCNRRSSDSSISKNAEGSKPSLNPSLVIRAVGSPTGPDSREPDLYSTADGRVVMSWVEKVTDKRVALRVAMRTADGWSEPRTVAEGENWFVNWADFPSVIALPGGSLAAHWLVKSGSGTYAYDINLSLSKDGGKTWTKPIIPHKDKTQTEHGFVSLIPLADGRVGAVWVDGRALKDMKEHEMNGPLPVSMSLRYAAIDSKGKLFDEALLDKRICECCQTSGAMTADGPIAAYRARSESEVRDIYVVRQQNGKWSEPHPVHQDGWKISACPVNGPSIAADGQKVVVAWYTEADDNPRVQVAFSNDSGRTFGSAIKVDDGNAIGRVDVLFLSDGSALVSWMAGTAEKGANKVRRVRADGTYDDVSIVAETDINRSSGFTRTARTNNEVLFAWTVSGKPSRIDTAVGMLSSKK